MKTLTTILSILFVLPVLAQGAPPATPIDGGLGILLIAGGAYAVNMVTGRRKE